MKRNSRKNLAHMFYKYRTIYHFLLLILAVLCVATFFIFKAKAYTPGAFVTTWQTTTNGESITIPTYNLYTYNYNVDWGDSTTSVGVTGDATHIYSTAGTYTVEITGTFPSIYFYAGTDKQKIYAVNQWGTTTWAAMNGAFYGCTHLQISASDVPDLSSVVSMNGMFVGATSFNSYIGNWDVSHVTDMALMFNNATAFNQDLSGWDVSHVTDIGHMFQGAAAFNQDISGWDVSNVAGMVATFSGATAFNNGGQPMPWGAKTHSVVNMDSMFADDVAFNQDISGWDVSGVTNMADMFAGATSFNQPLNSWDVSHVINMSDMFLRATSFNQPLNLWNVSSVTNMSHMFQSSAFNQDINMWNVSSVLYMLAMFESDAVFNNGGQPLTWGAKTHLVVNMAYMFYQASSFNQDISNWDVSSVTTMEGMFAYASIFNQNISAWQVLHVTSMYTMFFNATAFNQPIGVWNVSSVIDMGHMFQSSTFNQDIGDWDVSSVISMEALFSGDAAFNNAGQPMLWGAKTHLVTNMNYVFYGATPFNQDISGWDVSKVTAMAGMFTNDTAFNQNLSSWDVSKVTDMAGMFSGDKLSTANYDALLAGWDLLTLKNNVEFNGGNSLYCKSATQRAHIISTYTWTIYDAGVDPLCGAFITTWKTDNPGTSNNNQITIPSLSGGYNYNVNWGDGNTSTGLTNGVTHTYSSPGTYTVSIYGTFPKIPFGGSGDKDKLLSIEQWGTQQWTSMENAFLGCSNVVNNATDVPDLSHATSLYSMFYQATSFADIVQSMDSWDVSHITTTEAMFVNATAFNQDLSSWDVSHVTTMTNMFSYASSFNNGDTSNVHSKPLTWDVHSVTKMDNMFSGASSFNQDLSSWNVSNVIDMSWMFAHTNAFNQNISSWDVSKVATMYAMFYQAGAFNNGDTTNVATKPLTWNFQNITTNLEAMFTGAVSFNQNVSSWDVSNVTDMTNMFSSALIFNNGDTSNAESKPLTSWNVHNVTTMNGMFYGTHAFNQDVGNWDVSKVTTMNSMFMGAYIFNQDLSAWNTQNVNDMYTMFYQAGAFNNSDTTNIHSKPLTWDVHNVTNMQAMFTGAVAFNQDLSSWDVHNVTNMQAMFDTALRFDQNLGTWNVSKVTTMAQMFSADTLSTTNYDNTLIGWYSLVPTPDLNHSVPFSGGNSKFCRAETDRGLMISTYGWTISDAGKDPSCGLGAPTVVITYPADGSAVGGTVAITATATDDLGVTQVEFYRGLTLIGTDTVGSGTTYTVNWNTFGLPPGGYILTAKAYDANSNVTTSAPVTVFITGAGGCVNCLSTHPATALTRTTATLNGTIDVLGNPTLTTYFNFSTDSNALVKRANLTPDATTTGPFSEAISGLTANTTYYFQACGFYVINVPNCGTIFSFTTLPDPSVVSTHAASGITTTSAIINGSVDSLGASSIMTYFNFGTDSLALTKRADLSPALVAASPFLEMVSGLSPNTTYYFQACGNTGAGPDFCGTTLSFTTDTDSGGGGGGGGCSTCVSTQMVSSLTDTTVTLNGNIDNLGYPSLTPYFKFGTTANNLTKQSDLATMLTTGLFSDSPTSLTPKTKYYYQACGIYQSNAEVCGSVLFFTTLDSTTGGTNDLWDVTTFAATAVTATDAELNGEVTVTEGTTCSSGSCFVTYFQFGPYDASGIFTTTLSNPGTQGAAAFRRGATGLTPNTQYQYEACADYVNDLNVTVTKCNPIRYFTTLAKDTDLCPNTPGLQDQAYLDAHNGACTDGSGDLCPDVPGIQTQAYLDAHNGSCTNGPDNPTDGGGSPIITGGGGKVITTIGIITGALSIAVSVNPALVSTVPEAWSLLLVSFGLLKRGKKRGVIYDSVTKAPIPNVFVELIDQNGKQIETAITDTEGRYDFLVPPGAYTIHVKKDGYVFPSMLLGHVKRDELYLNLYFGNYIEVTKNENVIAVNVPVDPIIFNQDEVRKHEEAIAQAYEHRVIIFNRVSDILFGIGIIVSLVAFIVSPNIYNIVVFGIYIALLIGKEVGVSLSKLGTIVKKDTGQPLAGAIIRVFSATMGNEVIHKVTTETGKFYCLIPNGTYIVTIEEKQPDGTYAKVFTSKEFVVEKGTIRGTWGV